MSEQLQNSSEGELCRSCHRFFGSQQTNFLCSQCFKKCAPATHPDSQPSVIVSPSIPPVEETKDPVPIEPSRCGKCKRRLMPTCFLCKCGETFCTKCRQPEVHLCAFDRRTQGLRKLSESNPVVTADKVNKF